MGFLVALALLFCGPVQAEPSWESFAKQVGQNESSRQEALKELNKIEDLDESLIQALDGPHRALALDAIAALQAKHLSPQLLLKVFQDDDGFLVLCLSTLFDNKNKSQLLGTYKRLIAAENQKSLSPGALVALLEPLGRLGSRLPQATLSSLFEHDFPEVRQAALSYVRTMTLRNDGEEYSHFINKALDDKIYQVRLQTYSLLGELHQQAKLSPPVKVKQLKARCYREKKSFVKSACLRWLSAESEG